MSSKFISIYLFSPSSIRKSQLLILPLYSKAVVCLTLLRCLFYKIFSIKLLQTRYHKPFFSFNPPHQVKEFINWLKFNQSLNRYVLICCVFFVKGSYSRWWIDRVGRACEAARISNFMIKHNQNFIQKSCPKCTRL